MLNAAAMRPMISAAAVLALPQSRGTARPSRAEGSPFTTEEAARELGFTAETVRKYRVELGGYRLGRGGPWRFPAASVAFFKAHPRFITQPRATVRELWQTMERINLLSNERERRMATALASVEKRLLLLEAAGLVRAA